MGREDEREKKTSEEQKIDNDKPTASEQGGTKGLRRAHGPERPKKHSEKPVLFKSAKSHQNRAGAGWIKNKLRVI